MTIHEQTSHSLLGHILKKMSDHQHSLNIKTKEPSFIHSQILPQKSQRLIQGYPVPWSV